MKRIKKALKSPLWQAIILPLVVILIMALGWLMLSDAIRFTRTCHWIMCAERGFEMMLLPLIPVAIFLNKISPGNHLIFSDEFHDSNGLRVFIIVFAFYYSVGLILSYGFKLLANNKK